MPRGEASSSRPRGSVALSVALSWARRWFEAALLAMTVGLLAAGGVAWVAGSSGWADALWAAATVVAVVPAAGWVVAAVLRRTLGVDLIAVLALLGTLAVREYLAGALIAVMLGDRPHARSRRPAARHPGSTGAAGTRPAHRAQAGRRPGHRGAGG